MKKRSRMGIFEPFKYKNLSDLIKKIAELEIHLPIHEDVDILQQSIKSDNIIIPNRIAIQPMEAFDAKEDGSPEKLTFRRYSRYATGGVGLIWFEATAISQECRSNPHQLYLTRENAKEFKKLVLETREKANQTLNNLGFDNPCKLILQLNHSGRYSKLNDNKYPIRAYHNSEFDSASRVTQDDGKVITDDELEVIKDTWIEKALIAKDVGFDGVDIKACHGYIMSDLLSARLRTSSIYGGYELENRSKLLFDIIKSLNKKVSSKADFIVTTRFGLYDGVPYPNGFGTVEDQNEIFPAEIDLKEPIKIIDELYDLGIRLINLTAGNPHYKPQITRPFDIPVEGGKIPDEHPLFGVHRMIDMVGEVRKKNINDLIIIGSGYSYLRQFAGYVAAGAIQENLVDVCGFGRMAFANPNFPKQLFLEGKIDKKKTCITCSKCSGFMKMGISTGCAIRDPFYREKSL